MRYRVRGAPFVLLLSFLSSIATNPISLAQTSVAPTSGGMLMPVVETRVESRDRNAAPSSFPSLGVATANYWSDPATLDPPPIQFPTLAPLAVENRATVPAAHQAYQQPTVDPLLGWENMPDTVPSLAPRDIPRDWAAGGIIGNSVDIDWIGARAYSSANGLSDDALTGFRARMFLGDPNQFNHRSGTASHEIILSYLGRGYETAITDFEIDAHISLFSLEANALLRQERLHSARTFLFGPRFIQFRAGLDATHRDGRTIDFADTERLFGFQLGAMQEIKIGRGLSADFGIRSGIYVNWIDEQIGRSNTDFGIPLVTEANAALRYNFNDDWRMKASVFGMNINKLSAGSLTQAGVSLGLEVRY